MTDEQAQQDLLFAVYAVRKSDPQPLIMTQLSFGRLMDEIIIPFQSGDMFFIDGAPVKASDLDRIKILKQNEHLISDINQFHWHLRRADIKIRELYGKQYHIRLEAILRENGEDITAQVINAYHAAIKPKLTNYLPNKEALLNAAVKIFIESYKTLSGIGPT